MSDETKKDIKNDDDGIEDGSAQNEVRHTHTHTQKSRQWAKLTAAKSTK